MGGYFAVGLVVLIICGYVQANIEHCQMRMPRLKRFSIPHMGVGDLNMEIRLELEYEGWLEIRWKKTIRTESGCPNGYETFYEVPLMKTAGNYIVAHSHFDQTWTSVLRLRRVTSQDIGRFRVEVDVLHPCNTLTMHLDVKRYALDFIDSDQVDVMVKAFPIRSNRVLLGLNLNGGLLVTYTASNPARHKRLSTSKWTRYISRTGVRNYLFVLDDPESAWQNRSGNFFTERGDLTHSETSMTASTNMSLRPFWQRDQGVFRTHFTYEIGSSVWAKVYVSTELRYSDYLPAAMKVKTCSTVADNSLNSDIEIFPVEAGRENCIECFAHGGPLPKIYLAKINHDLATGIDFQSDIGTQLFGNMSKMARYGLAKMAAGGEQYYVCTAGSKHYVSSLVFKVTAFLKVRMVASSPGRINLQNLEQGTLVFTCKATGYPIPVISFYRSGKNSALFCGMTPANMNWQEVTASVESHYNSVEKARYAKLTLPSPQAEYDYHCVASNDFSLQYRSVIVDDYSVGLRTN